GASIHAGVKIVFCAAGLDLGVDHPAQSDAKSGELGGEHLGVGDESEVGLEAVAVLADEAGNLFATNFFLSFKYYPYVDGQFAVIGHEKPFESLDVHVHLALVVDSSAGE